jgi:hypothetical protein
MHKHINLKKFLNKFRSVYRNLINNQFFELITKINQIGIARVLWLIQYSEYQQGGLNSSKGSGPFDGSGIACPWYTYSAIEYLKQLDLSKTTLFEYGSGNSTKFWRTRVSSMCSVESCPEWYGLVSKNQTKNQVVILRTQEAEYINSIREFDAIYDIIVIDGEHRYSCAITALDFLKSDGMLILDNSDWFPELAHELRRLGYMQIDFIGPGPINSYAWCTSIFLREISKHDRYLKNNPIEVIGGITKEGIRK